MLHIQTTSSFLNVQYINADCFFVYKTLVAVFADERLDCLPLNDSFHRADDALRQTISERCPFHQYVVFVQSHQVSSASSHTIYSKTNSIERFIINTKMNKELVFILVGL
jgi:hypothetical protein